MPIPTPTPMGTEKKQIANCLEATLDNAPQAGGLTKVAQAWAMACSQQEGSPISRLGACQRRSDKEQGRKAQLKLRGTG